MDIVLASRNKKKIKELETLLSCITSTKINILSLDDIGCTEDIEENGSTFEENARIKASVPAKMGYISIADDSGLMVDALDGAPGIHSARFSGKGDKANNELLMEKLKGLPTEKRTARFVTSVVCIFPEHNEEIVTSGVCEGVITEEPFGDGGFGYDPYFFYPPLNKTFSQLTADEKNAVSHRGKAMRAFAKELEKTAKRLNLK